MGIDAILFNIIEFMKKQSDITAGLEKSITAENALLIQNALTYRKGLISETSTDSETLTLFIKVLHFARALTEALAKPCPFELEKTKFGQEILAHRKQVEIQIAEREKKSTDQEDRSHYTLTLATKRFRYAYLAYQLLIPSGKQKPQSTISEYLCESALSMVNEVDKTYGLYNPNETTFKPAATNVHRDDAAVGSKLLASMLASSSAASLPTTHHRRKSF